VHGSLFLDDAGSNSCMNIEYGKPCGIRLNHVISRIISGWKVTLVDKN